ncbi:CS domain [Trinorchestia longiramus]|nr:CS domain [Trinorchestia longiramus]
MGDKECYFDERSGKVECPVAWGTWWQTVAEVHLELDVAAGTKSKMVTVQVTPSTICVSVGGGAPVIQGQLFDKVVADETLWTLEDAPKPPDGGERGRLLHIVLTKLGGGRLGPKKGQTGGGEGLWDAILRGEGERWGADLLTLHQMRQKLDLERFQMENPGFDFSSAKLSKCYDSVPGLGGS